MRFMPTNFESLELKELPDAIVMLMPDGNVVHRTKGATEVLGYASEEAFGSFPNSFLALPDRMDEKRRYMKTTLEPESCNYESIRRRKDGSLFLHRSIKPQRLANEIKTCLHQRIRSKDGDYFDR
jgi:PAS domain S-box-containing protein